MNKKIVQSITSAIVILMLVGIAVGYSYTNTGLRAPWFATDDGEFNTSVNTYVTNISAQITRPQVTGQEDVDTAQNTSIDAINSTKLNKTDLNATVNPHNTNASNITSGTLTETRFPANYNATQVYNVRAFGAVGDGTTNDTAAINTAIARGNMIYIPDGTYNVTHLNTVPANTIIFGSGNATIQMHGTYTTDTAVFTLSSNSKLYNIQFKTKTDSTYNYEGNTISYLNHSIAVVTASNADNVEIYGLNITGYDIPLYAYSASNVKMHHNKIRNGYQSLTSFYLVTGGEFAFNDAKVTSPVAGVSFASSTGIRIIGNEIEAKNSTGINPGGSSAAPAYDYIISDNNITAQNPIAAENGVSNIIITNNNIIVNTPAPDGTGIGVNSHIASPSPQNNIIIQGNVIKSSAYLAGSDLGNLYSLGITIQCSAVANNNSQHIVIRGNEIDGATQGILTQTTCGKFNDTIIESNTILNSYAYGINVNNITGSIKNNIITHSGYAGGINPSRGIQVTASSRVMLDSNKIGVMVTAAYSVDNSFIYIIHPECYFKTGDGSCGVFSSLTGSNTIVMVDIPDYYTDDERIAATQGSTIRANAGTETGVDGQKNMTIGYYNINGTAAGWLPIIVKTGN